MKAVPSWFATVYVMVFTFKTHHTTVDHHLFLQIQLKY